MYIQYSVISSVMTIINIIRGKNKNKKPELQLLLLTTTTKQTTKQNTQNILILI